MERVEPLPLRDGKRMWEVVRTAHKLHETDGGHGEEKRGKEDTRSEPVPPRAAVLAALRPARAKTCRDIPGEQWSTIQQRTAFLVPIEEERAVERARARGWFFHAPKSYTRTHCNLCALSGVCKGALRPCGRGEK